MLNYVKLLAQIQHLSYDYVTKTNNEIEQAYAAWNKLVTHPELCANLLKNASNQSLPTPISGFEQIRTTGPVKNHYQVFGIDGSQVYPDRHVGFPCYLINIGYAQFNYASRSDVKLSNDPYIFFNDEDLEASSIDTVNAHRQELELQGAIKDGQEPIYLFDGSLIFWHLVGKEQSFFESYFSRSIHILQQLFEQKKLTVWYISNPKSKELISCLNAAHKQNAEQFPNTFSYVRDAALMKLLLADGQRTDFFLSNVAIAQLYPPHLRPVFCYFNIGCEIARIEVPCWIAQQPSFAERVISIIFDQTQKGDGYPVCLAEAHEQAVIKSADRDLFFQMVAKWGYDNDAKFASTQKLAKKRRMAI